MSEDAIVEITYMRDSPYEAPYSGDFVTNHFGDQEVTFYLSRWSGGQWSGSTCTYDSYGPIDMCEEDLHDLLVAIKAVRPDAWERIGRGGTPSGGAAITETFFPA